MNLFLAKMIPVIFFMQESRKNVPKQKIGEKPQAAENVSDCPVCVCVCVVVGRAIVSCSTDTFEMLHYGPCGFEKTTPWNSEKV